MNGSALRDSISNKSSQASQLPADGEVTGIERLLEPHVAVDVMPPRLNINILQNFKTRDALLVCLDSPLETNEMLLKTPHHFKTDIQGAHQLSHGLGKL
jgi:hypothetical protein